MKRKTNKHSKGFTLLELMVISAIVGILMTIALANYISYRNKGFCSQAESDAGNLVGPISNYFSLPIHTMIPKPSDLKVETRNPYDLQGDANGTVSIVVTDRTGRCPSAYKQANASNGWIPGTNVFVKEIY